MIWRRRRNDGFEWHRHVRTTVKLNRDKRHQRIDRARAVAAAQMERAKAASIEGAKQGVEVLARSSAEGAEAAKRGAQAAAAASRDVAQNVWQRARRIPVSRWTHETGIVLSSMMARLAALMAQLAQRLAQTLQAYGLPHLSNRTVLAGAATIVVAVGVGLVSLFGGLSASPVGSAVTALSGGKPEVIEGRARAVSGDTMRIAGRVIRLAGIEAPELIQRCKRKNGRTWRCGIAARNALRRLTGRKRVTCRIEHHDTGGVRVAACTLDGKDIAATLAERGLVFARSALLSRRYSSEVNAAQSARRGIWRGEPDRPSDVRDAAWARAKKSAPDGCPIKAKVRRGRRMYYLPWTPGYRSKRVSKRRGERWFCSEAEALAAGWKPATTG